MEPWAAALLSLLRGAWWTRSPPRLLPALMFLEFCWTCLKHFFLSDKYTDQHGWKCLEIPEIKDGAVLQPGSAGSTEEFLTQQSVGSRWHWEIIICKVWGHFNSSPPQISGLSAGGLFYEKEKVKTVWQNRYLPQALTTVGTWTQKSFTGTVSGALSGISLGQITLFS